MKDKNEDDIGAITGLWIGLIIGNLVGLIIGCMVTVCLIKTGSIIIPVG